MKKWLIIDSDGECRIRSRLGNIRVDQVAYELVIDMPEAWGAVQGKLEILMPEPPVAALGALHDEG